MDVILANCASLQLYSFSSLVNAVYFEFVTIFMLPKCLYLQYHFSVDSGIKKERKRIFCLGKGQPCNKKIIINHHYPWETEEIT